MNVCCSEIWSKLVERNPGSSITYPYPHPVPTPHHNTKSLFFFSLRFLSFPSPYFPEYAPCRIRKMGSDIIYHQNNVFIATTERSPSFWSPVARRRKSPRIWKKRDVVTFVRKEHFRDSAEPEQVPHLLWAVTSPARFWGASMCRKDRSLGAYKQYLLRLATYPDILSGITDRTRNFRHKEIQGPLRHTSIGIDFPLPILARGGFGFLLPWGRIGPDRAGQQYRSMTANISAIMLHSGDFHLLLGIPSVLRPWAPWLQYGGIHFARCNIFAFVVVYSNGTFMDRGAEYVA